jgi:hypothetical protein
MITINVVPVDYVSISLHSLHVFLYYNTTLECILNSVHNCV